MESFNASLDQNDLKTLNAAMVEMPYKVAAPFFEKLNTQLQACVKAEQEAQEVLEKPVLTEEEKGQAAQTQAAKEAEDSLTRETARSLRGGDTESAALREAYLDSTRIDPNDPSIAERN